MVLLIVVVLMVGNIYGISSKQFRRYQTRSYHFQWKSFLQCLTKYNVLTVCKEYHYWNITHVLFHHSLLCCYQLKVIHFSHSRRSCDHWNKGKHCLLRLKDTSRFILVSKYYATGVLSNLAFNSITWLWVVFVTFAINWKLWMFVYVLHKIPLSFLFSLFLSLYKREIFFFILLCSSPHFQP